MTATSEVRFGADGTAKVQSYVRDYLKTKE